LPRHRYRPLILTCVAARPLETSTTVDPAHVAAARLLETSTTVDPATCAAARPLETSTAVDPDSRSRVPAPDVDDCRFCGMRGRAPA
jgi:hypothetical protein